MAPTKKTEQLKNMAAKIFAAMLALLVWQAAAMLMNNRLLLVGPLQVLARLQQLILLPGTWKAIGFTFSRITLGFLAAMLLAAVLAAISARFHLMEILLHPYIAAVQAVPVASFIVIAFLWLSSKRLSSFIAFLMVLPVLYSNLLQGIRSADRQLLEMAAVFRMTWYRRISSIYLPAVYPYVRSACHAALGLCWKAGVAAEVIGVCSGSIGGMLYDAKVYLEIADLFSWTSIIILVSLCFEKAFQWFLKKFFGLLEEQTWILH